MNAPGAAAGELRKPYPLRRKVGLGAEIVSTYARVRWWLVRRELPWVVERLRALEADDAPAWSDYQHVRVGLRLGRVINRTLRLVPADSRCLVRSLVLVGLLARRGIASTLVIGVKPEPSFAAHAWVEADSIPLLPTGGSEYARLIEL